MMGQLAAGHQHQLQYHNKICHAADLWSAGDDRGTNLAICEFYRSPGRHAIP